MLIGWSTIMMIMICIFQVQLILNTILITSPIGIVSAAFSTPRATRRNIYSKITFTPTPSLVALNHLDNEAIHTYLPRHGHRHSSLSRYTSTSTSTSLASSTTVTPLSDSILSELNTKNYVVVPNYLPPSHVAALRSDVTNLRSSSHFNIAKIGQDSTNTLNENIRVAETCFLGKDKRYNVPGNQPGDDAREDLYNLIDDLRNTLSGNTALDRGDNAVAPTLDASLSELLYAYYPNGGFYRRHVDAMPQSVSVLRAYSLLIYLNSEWEEGDGGNLRIHLDSGGDERPEGERENYVDVKPEGGTLVLFRSDMVPHEVLDTVKERLAVVGWYNRPFTSGDVASLASEEDKKRGLLLIVAAGLVTVGVVGLFV